MFKTQIRKQSELRQSGARDATKATKILLTIVSIYIPSIILGGLVFYFTLNFPELDNSSQSYWLLAAFRVLLTINSASNFVIYCIYGRDFRQGLSKCWGKKESQGEGCTPAQTCSSTKFAKGIDNQSTEVTITDNKVDN